MFPFRLPPVVTFVSLALAVVSASTASADTRRHKVNKSRVVRTRAYSHFQHFSMRSPSTALTGGVRIGYYSPRSIPRSRPVEQDEDFGPAPAVQSSGSRPIVSGARAVIRNGVAYAPSNAPERVKSAIWAVNTIRRKPYHWGGGHGSFQDSGYDCSGTVSFALHHAGALNQPLPSSDLLRFGERGRGRWITVYSRRGHTFAMIAGLRLDTTDFRYGGDVGPRWHNDGRETRGFEARHPTGL